MRIPIANQTIQRLALCTYFFQSPMLCIPNRHFTKSFNIINCRLSNFFAPATFTMWKTKIFMKNVDFSKFLATTIVHNSQEDIYDIVGSQFTDRSQINQSKSNYKFLSCTFANCNGEFGGVLKANSVGYVKFFSSSFTSCTATKNGGALFVYQCSSFILNSCQFKQCTAQLGGSTYVYQTSFYFYRTEFSGSNAVFGGANYHFIGPANTGSVSACLYFANNSASSNVSAHSIHFINEGNLVLTYIRFEGSKNLHMRVDKKAASYEDGISENSQDETVIKMNPSSTFTPSISATLESTILPTFIPTLIPTLAFTPIKTIDSTPIYTPLLTPNLTPIPTLEYTPIPTHIPTLGNTPINTLNPSPNETPIFTPYLTPYPTYEATLGHTPNETPDPTLPNSMWPTLSFTLIYTPMYTLILTLSETLIHTPHTTPIESPINTPQYTPNYTPIPTIKPSSTDMFSPSHIFSPSYEFTPSSVFTPSEKSLQWNNTGIATVSIISIVVIMGLIANCYICSKMCLNQELIITQDL